MEINKYVLKNGLFLKFKFNLKMIEINDLTNPVNGFEVVVQCRNNSG
jgi:hypothetical protein